MKYIKVIIFLFVVQFLLGFAYVYYYQKDVIVNGINIDETLKIAKNELKKDSFDSVLGIWVIRDQVFTGAQASEIAKMYFDKIDKLNNDFSIWHLAWAVSNIYRNGNDEVKNAINDAYLDAVKRPERLKNFKSIANLHINGDKIYMGDIHGLGRAYAHSHIIAPGNKKYLQSYEEYEEKILKK
jgi:hypothetical protein